MLTPGEPGVAAARADAARAAERSGVVITQVHELGDLEVVRRLIDRIWRPPPEDPPVTQGVLRALTHGGNYCALAHDGDEAVGVCLGFLGLTPPRSLHSHIAGVTDAVAGRHVGRALKLDQRAWALERELTSILWTYDPLIRRNAYFNATKLGALPTGYLVDFYGAMNDAINVGQPTDRLAVEWRLTDPAVAEICAGRGSEPRSGALREAGAEVVLEDVGGEPTRGDGDGRADVRLIRVPLDVEALRRTDPERARRWRLAVRAALGGSMDDDWKVTGMTRDGYYALQRGAR